MLQPSDVTVETDVQTHQLKTAASKETHASATAAASRSLASCLRDGCTLSEWCPAAVALAWCGCLPFAFSIWVLPLLLATQLYQGCLCCLPRCLHAHITKACDVKDKTIKLATSQSQNNSPSNARGLTMVVRIIRQATVACIEHARQAAQLQHA